MLKNVAGVCLISDAPLMAHVIRDKGWCFHPQKKAADCIEVCVDGAKTVPPSCGVISNQRDLLLCCRFWAEARVFKAELLVGGEVKRLLKSPLEINGMTFYYTVIT